MGTKNNPKNRAKGTKKKQFDGKDVEPILYNGTHIGHGKYIAAKFSGSTQLVTASEEKKPISWDSI